MNLQFGNQGFDRLEQFFKEAGNVHAVAEQSVATSKAFYDKAAGAAKEGAKAFTEIAETTWGCMKMLNEKIAQNLMNMESAFTPAAATKSLNSVR